MLSSLHLLQLLLTSSASLHWASYARLTSADTLRSERTIVCHINTSTTWGDSSLDYAMGAV